jgi:hypothetical protein
MLYKNLWKNPEGFNCYISGLNQNTEMPLENIHNWRDKYEGRVET